MNRDDLHAYQEKAVQFILRHPRAALWLDMGLGKTVSTLTAIAELIRSGEVATVLVATKKLIALQTWPDEVRKWDQLRDLKVTPIIGSKEARTKALALGADIYTINVENLSWLFSERLKYKCPFDMIVLDESSLFKNGAARRSKVMRFICDKVSRVVALTGTPAANGYMDLWGQYRLIDKGERLMGYITHFRNRYFYPQVSHGHITYKWGLKDGAKEAIERQIADITLSMTAKDYLELPETIVNDIYVELPDKALKRYDKFKDEAVLELKGKTITAANAAALSGKLMQAANGAIYTEEGDDKWEELHRAKIDKLKEIMDTAVSPVLIAYTYRHDRERILDALKDYEPRDASNPDAIRAWNRGDLPCLIGHPASVGHGLNLQAGGHTIVWFGLPWNLEYYDQFNARLARQGQTERVIIHRLLANHTIDVRVAHVIGDKGDRQKGLIEALKGEIDI